MNKFFWTKFDFTLTVVISTSEDIQFDSWIKLLSQCQRVSKIEVDLDQFLEPKIKVSSWQDHFATALVSNMKNMRHLNIGFHLSSEGLRLVAHLENLEYFVMRSIQKTCLTTLMLWFIFCFKLCLRN